MTFDQIVAEVMDRLNLTSPTATTRIGKEVNDRYRRLTSSIGLEVSRRSQVSTVVTIGNRVVTFTGVEKVIAVIDKSSGKDKPLEHITLDEMHIIPLRGDPPRHFSVSGMHVGSVDVTLDATPATAYTLYADGHLSLSILSGAATPNISESFHDILVWGAMADEYRKMEKLPFMQDAETNYEKRLSDLRMWIAKSGYLDITQGRYASKNFRYPRNFDIMG